MITRKYWTEAVKRRVACSQGYLCNICRIPLPAAWQADHKIALQDGGDNSISNCQIICGNCHAEKTQLENIRARSRQKTIPKVSKYFDPTSPFYLPHTSFAQFMAEKCQL